MKRIALNTMNEEINFVVANINSGRGDFLSELFDLVEDSNQLVRDISFDYYHNSDNANGVTIRVKGEELVERYITNGEIIFIEDEVFQTSTADSLNSKGYIIDGNVLRTVDDTIEGLSFNLNDPRECFNALYDYIEENGGALDKIDLTNGDEVKFSYTVGPNTFEESACNGDILIIHEEKNLTLLCNVDSLYEHELQLANEI